MASKYSRSSKKTFQEKEEPKTDDEKIKALTSKSKTRKQQNIEIQASTKQPKEKATNKKPVGHFGMILRPRGNRTSAQFRVVSPSAQINKNLQVNKPLDSEISLNQNKKKSRCSSVDAVSSQSKTIDQSTLNLKSTKKILQNSSEDLPTDLCRTLLENEPEDFTITNKKPVVHSGTVLKKKGNNARIVKPVNVDSSPKQIRRSRNSQVKKLLDSEILSKQKKLEGSSGDAVSSQSKTIDQSKLNLKSAKEMLKSTSKDLPPDLGHTLLENIPEDLMASTGKRTSHKGLKFIPNARKKSLLSFTINEKQEEL